MLTIPPPPLPSDEWQRLNPFLSKDQFASTTTLLTAALLASSRIGQINRFVTFI